MKKKLIIGLCIVCVVSLMLNGLLISQNSKYRAMEDKLENVNGTVSYYAFKELGYYSEVAYGYSYYLKNVLDGKNTLDDWFYYAEGILERDQDMEGIIATHLDGVEHELKAELVDLTRDIRSALYIKTKDDVIRMLSQDELKELRECYDTMENILSENNKKGFTVYFRNHDYTSDKSMKVQSELRYTIERIETLLTPKENPETTIVSSNMNKPMQIEGSFVAKVRGVLPNYVLDDTTPCYALVTMFQSGPFLIHMGSLADDLEIGQCYAFQIAPKKLGKKASDLDKTLLSPERAIPSYNLKIERYHKVDDIQYSQNDLQLKYTVVE